VKIFEKWFVIIILVVILILIGENLRLSVVESRTNSQAANPFAVLASKPKIGSPVPDFVLSTTDGRKISVNQLRGKAVVINFWATWCVACLEEMPLLQAATVNYPEDVVVLAVNVAEDVKKVSQFQKLNEFSFPILLDLDGKVANTFGVFGYPATYFVDKEGIIRYQQIGQMNETKLNNNLKTIGIDTW
jgi:cytochrome c biogenesis protein CcmG/thiol:disulfide interchange protein DsbE